ncbi:glycosyltransferase [Candidatus Saccharibacteria bacterium]|nr:glycosyltransferase [Candidatus Saccharibacteria bacterium]
MKIVVATAVYYPMINGVAMFSRNLAEGLSRRGHEVMVICPSQNGKSYTQTVNGVKVAYLKSTEVKVYPDQIHEVPERKKGFLGIKWPRLYKNGFRVSIFPKREIGRLLDDFRPDVVHVQVSDPIGLSVVGWARKHSVPVVTTEHNQPEVLTEPLHIPGLIRRPVNAMLSSYFANRQGKSDFVTMPTKQAIYRLLDGRKNFNVPVAAVSNGVNLASFHAGKASAATYQKYGILEGVPIVLYVGRVDPEKKVGLVMKAFERFMKDNKIDRLSRTCLVIVGDGVDKARLEKEASESEYNKQIFFLGRVVGEELGEIYRIGTVFVTASEIETQGIVLIEAAASGLPLVAVDSGAVGEICIDGENGFLCQPENVTEISAVMEKILSDDKLRDKFAKRSVELASEHDFEKTLDKFLNIYKKVVATRRKS